MSGDIHFELTTSHLEILRGVSARTAQREMAKLRAFYGKNRMQMITIYEYCDFHQVDEYEVRKALFGEDDARLWQGR